jgi:hypothetical protein
MPDANELPGRSGIVALFKECLRREGARDLPITLLLGPRGSGKTWTLTYLWKACQASVALPHALIDCATGRRDTVWRLVCEIADELRRHWPEFGTLRFRRVTLARLAVEPHDLPEDLDRARERLRELLGHRAKLKEHAETAVDVAQAFDVALAEVRLVGRVTQRIASSRSVEMLYRTGLSWYGALSGQHGDGLAALVKLNWLIHRDGNAQDAERILVQALLADLADAFAGRKRRSNCALLLDNCAGAGNELLNLLAEIRAASRDCDPLVVFAACRSVPELSGLRAPWIFPWEEPFRSDAGKREVPTPEAATYATWGAGRRNRQAAESWWLPVLLRDLSLAEIADLVSSDRRRFVHRLTLGHPWSVGQLPTVLDGDDRATVLERFGPKAKYLISGLSEHQHKNLILLAAGRDLEFPSRAGIGLRGAEAAPDLADVLDGSLWLIKGTSRHGPRLHPLLRRMLLWELAGTAEWKRVHGTLREYAGRHGLPVELAYHALACGEIGPAVDYLCQQLHDLDADHWIRAFNEITSAPGLRSPTESPESQHESLLRNRELPDRTGVRDTLWSLVAARWIWADPVGDPAFSLADTIADGFVLLTKDVETGRARFHREAKAYREMRP